LGKPHQVVDLGILGWIVAVGAFLIAVPRYYLRSPILGEPGNAGVCLIAVAACGDTRVGSVYMGFVVAFLVVQIMALSKTDRGRPAWSTLTTKHYVMIILGVPVAGIVAAALVVGLPVLHDWTVNRFTASLTENRTGFSTQMHLGTLDGMYQSNEVVMRIRGPRPGLLRGIVYARYSDGSFFVDRSARAEKIILLSDRKDENRVSRIQVVGGDRDRYFLPLLARGIRIENDPIFADRTGIVTGEDGEADEVMFVRGPRDRANVGGPGIQDLRLPEEIKSELAQIATAWTETAHGEGEKLKALEKRLGRNFSYSFHFRRTRGVDPVLDFLTRSKKGHCEYFASAMALLSRSLGIPARVVGGYRVSELNPFWDYYIVRERNAHAWVEAWVEGVGWTTFDPTPGSEIAGTVSPPLGGVAALGDFLALKWTDGMRWLARRTPMQFTIVVAALLAVWFTIRTIRKLREKRKGMADQLPLFSDPAPALIELLAYLASRGVSVTTGEALESFAQRIERSKELGVDGVRAAHLVHRYAAWRYGEHGDIAEVSKDIETWLG
jgi:transglutaminase-like putative cysteine protease